jgi:hypothetical protein
MDPMGIQRSSLRDFLTFDLTEVSFDHPKKS